MASGEGVRGKGSPWARTVLDPRKVLKKGKNFFQ